jgi:hypothetical protein
MSLLYHELKDRFERTRCNLKASTDVLTPFSIDTYPHCSLEDTECLKKCSLFVLLFKSKSLTNDKLAVLLTIRNFGLRKFPGKRVLSYFLSSSLIVTRSTIKAKYAFRVVNLTRGMTNVLKTPPYARQGKR